VIELLNEVRESLLCVRGNCDTEVDQMVLNFPVLADYAALFVDGRRWYLTHGHKWNAETPLPMQKGDLLLCGHTHVPTVLEFGDGNRYLNPGSTSIPKESSPKSYMVYEDGIFYWKALDSGEVYRTLAL
jgi:putative phosphoesterase